jgi:preprotein translocase subunit YajC
VDSVGALVPFVLIIGAFYVLIIRPSRNRAKTQQRLLDKLEVGARVMTTSGLYAEVTAIEDDRVLLEVAPGVTMRWTKAAVARILPEPDAEDTDEIDDAGETHADESNAAENDTDDEDAPDSPVSLSKSDTNVLSTSDTDVSDGATKTVDAASDADSAERPT